MRTITTWEELNELAEESIIMEHLYRNPLHKFIGTWRFGDELMMDITFPVTVLWEPNAEGGADE